MSPRLPYLLSIEHAPTERDGIGSLTAAARMADRRKPCWERHALVMAR
jgi:hypothetical protein